MTLPGVTPFPPEFAARYRARGYWADRPLIAHFLDAFDQFADRMAVIDDTGSYTYAELADASQRVALNLLDLGLRPGDRVVLQLPNTRFFASLYFGLQRIGAIPIMALPSHRYRELRQFVGLSGAVAAAAPATAGETDFAELHRRVSAEHPGLRLSILQGRGGRGTWRRAGRGTRPDRARGAARAPPGPPLARRPGPDRGRDRPVRSGGIPAVRRHHRHTEAHPAHA